MIGHLFVAILRESEPGMACRAEPKDSIGNNLGCLNCPPRTATGESGLGLSKHGHPLKGKGGHCCPPFVNQISPSTLANISSFRALDLSWSARISQSMVSHFSHQTTIASLKARMISLKDS